MKALRPEIREELRRLAIALVMLLAILAGLALVRRQRLAEYAMEVRIMPGEEIVFDWSQDACDPEDIPDAPVQAFRDAAGRIQLLIARHENRRLLGTDHDRLVHDCTVVLSSHLDPDPAHFDDREWISSIYSPDGVTVFALIHNEYQGHRHPGQCPSGDYWKCWYNTVTLAISRDSGDSYTHAQPPGHLVASLPYPYEPDAGPMGIFAPSNIIRHPKDGYYYVFIRIPRNYRQQGSGACLMRTNNLADPSSWRAWNGRSFSVAFMNPYERPGARPEQHVCQPVSQDHIQLMTDSLTYNTYLDRFVLLGTGSSQQVGGQATTGIYYSFSEDLIHWTPRRLLIEAELPWSFECGDEPPINYPSVIDPESDSRNFETSDRRAYLYFTRFNVDSCALLGADLVRVAIEFDL